MTIERRGRRIVRACGAAAAFVALFAALACAIARLAHAAPGPFTDPVDFRAFACGGSALAERRDPYRVEPMRGCQRAALAAAGLSTDRQILPAPLPPYALAFFAAFAGLPYPAAAAIWLAAALAALGASLFLLSELAGIRPLSVAPALVFAAGIVPLLVGQLVPVVLAGALCAALAARRPNGLGIALGAALTSIEPHLGLPVWLGLFALVPPARVPLLVTGALLASVSLAAGPALDWEYLRAVLPQHARSELLNFGEQYALSPLLASAGVPFDTALRAGSACYAAMLGVGIGVAWALLRRTADAAFCVTAPLACVVLGGPFLHVHQTAAALPLAFMLLGRAPRRGPAFACALVCVVCLAVPWQLLRETLPAPPLGAAERRAAAAELHRAAPAGESLEIPYTAYVDALAPHAYRRSFADLLLWKLPTWCGLLLLVATAGAFGFGYRARALTGTELVEPNIRSPASPSPGTM